MDTKYNLYPLKFFPVASQRPWGGTALSGVLGKKFIKINDNGTQEEIPSDELIGESWEIADMGIVDSVVANGWLAGNTISELMETYMERLVGDRVFDWYGTQFPLLVKFLDIEGKLSVQCHPDDETAAQRYDSLGKTEVWYVVDAKPSARIYMGFKKNVTVAEFYEASRNGTAAELLNVFQPHKGDVFFIKPGTVHAAEGGALICEVQESSDLTFRLYDWGREFNPATARTMHLEEAIDIIDYNAYDKSCFTPAQNSGDSIGATVSRLIADCPQFKMTHITLSDAVKVDKGQIDGFVLYSCINGEASIQMPDGNGMTKDWRICKGETILIPAECPDFILSSVESGTELLESVTIPEEESDSYTDGDDTHNL